MDEDDFDLNDNSEQDYSNSTASKIRRRLEKRPAQRNEEDFEDDDELFSERQDDARERDSSRAQSKKHQQHSSGFTSASRYYQQGQKGRGTGSGAETRRAPVEEEDADEDDMEGRGPTFRAVCQTLTWTCPFQPFIQRGSTAESWRKKQDTDIQIFGVYDVYFTAF